MKRLVFGIWVLGFAAAAAAQTPDIVGLRNGNITFTNLDTSMEYHVDWASGLGGTNQFNPQFRPQEYIRPTGAVAMTVSAPQFFRVGATNKLSNGIYRISDLPTVVTSGTSKIDIEWSDSQNGPWYTNWVTPQEQSDTSSIMFVQTPRFFRLSFITCPSNFASCTDWTDATDPSATREVDFPVGGNNYSPACLKIEVGQSVTFQALTSDFSAYPLANDCQENSAMTNVSSGTTAIFTFEKPGYFGYHCTAFGGMAGNIWVIP